MKNLLFLIVGGFAIGIILGVLNVQFDFWVFVVLLILAFIALSYRDVKYMFLSKDVEKIEKYLVKKRNEPYYGFILELANGNLTGAKKELEDLEKKWKGKKTAVFRSQYYLRVGNLQQAKEEVKLIDQDEIKTYILAAVAVEEKDTKKAEELKQQLRKEWMKLAIETELAIHQKNFTLANEKKKQALASTKGLQYFMLYKEFQKI
jgi:hypothetical protein